jgi:hypothetical protein
MNKLLLSIALLCFTTASFGQEQKSATTCVLSFLDSEFSGPESTSYPSDSFDIYVHYFPDGESRLDVVGGLTTLEDDVKSIAKSFGAFIETHYGVKSTIKCEDSIRN